MLIIIIIIIIITRATQRSVHQGSALEQKGYSRASAVVWLEQACKRL